MVRGVRMGVEGGMVVVEGGRGDGGGKKLES